MVSKSSNSPMLHPGHASAAFLLAAALPAAVAASAFEVVGCMDACREPAALLQAVAGSFIGLFAVYAAPSAFLIGVPIFLIFRGKIAPSLGNACRIGAILGFLPQASLSSIVLLVERKNPFVAPILFFVFGAPLGALGGLVFWAVALRPGEPASRRGAPSIVENENVP